MVAKEQAELDQLVGDLAVKFWFMAKEKVTKWKEKKEKGEGGGSGSRSTVDFWETTSGLFSYSASLGPTVDTCLVLLGVFLRPPCIWRSIVRRCLCLKSTIRDYSGR